MKLTQVNTLKAACVLLFIAIVAGSFSCKKTLELDPPNAMDAETALSTDGGVKQVLVGAYGMFGSANNPSFIYGPVGEGDIILMAELMAGQDELTLPGWSNQFPQLMLQQINNDHLYTWAVWTNRYHTIHTCNAVLGALEVVDAADRGRIEGEAKFLRGTALFELTKLFGQQYETGGSNAQLGVPIVLAPTLSSTDNAAVSRNTVEECYTQVLQDLSDARDLLPPSNEVYATTYAASAMLARVYLQQGDYANALTESNRVIESGMYSLVANYADAFGQTANTSEDVFAIQVTLQSGYNALNANLATPDFGGAAQIGIQPSFISTYDSLDQRKSLYHTNAGSWFTGKYNNRFGNYSVTRLAEMYLTRAECNERLGSSVGATPLEDYNVVHTRAGLAAAVSVTLSDILSERHFELAHEGFLINDLKRQHLDCGSYPYNDPKVILPIPQRDIDINPNLVQNPGY